MTNTDVKQISIRFLPDGFSFAGTFCPVAPGADYEKRLESALFDAGLNELASSDVEVVCSAETQRFVLSSADENTEQEAEQMYGVSLTDADSEEVLVHQSDAAGRLRITFGIDAELYHFMHRNLNEVTFVHPLMHLHEEWSGRVDADACCMIAQYEGSVLNLLVYKSASLYMANRFICTSSDNALYFVMNAWKQCALDVIDDKICIVTESEELRQNLGKYIKQCE